MEDENNLVSSNDITLKSLLKHFMRGKWEISNIQNILEQQVAVVTEHLTLHMLLFKKHKALELLEPCFFNQLEDYFSAVQSQA